MKHFNEITSSDYTESDDIQVLAYCIQDPSFMGPISWGTGCDWHSTATIFFGDYLIYCNRGFGDNKLGIYIYYLPDRSNISEAVTWEMTKRQEVEGGNSFDTKRIEKDLGGNLLHYEPMRGQGGGFCTYVSMETALFAFMALKHLLNFFGGKEAMPQECIDSSVWQQIFETLRAPFKVLEGTTIFESLIKNF